MPPNEAHSELASWIRQRREPGYRLQQAFPRLWQRPVGAWADTTDLPANLVQALTESFPLNRPVLATEQISSDGTIKFLW